MNWNCDSECMRVWEVAAQSIAAIGTLAAVIVSLWLARRHVVKINLTVSAARYFTETSQLPPDDQYENADFVLTIFNGGVADVVLTSVQWVYRLFGIFRTKWRQVPGFGEMPISVRPGERTELKMTLRRTPEGWKVRSFGGEFVAPPKPGRFARLVVTVAGGQSFSVRTWPMLSILSELPPGGRWSQHR